LSKCKKVERKEGKIAMEQEIEILIRYGEAGMNKRLNLYLQFPDLRWAFQEMEHKDMAAQMASRSFSEEHHKGKCPRLLSLLGRIIGIETNCNLLRTSPVS
jgi:hypothetical protein